MAIILHIAKQEQWEHAKRTGVYAGDTLETDGFIHCSTPKQIIKVANALFYGQKGLVLLAIDSDKVISKILYESAGGSERYPHIYGPLNLNAIVKVLKFEPNEDGTFKLPSFLQKSK